MTAAPILPGARIGVLRQAYERSTAGPVAPGQAAPKDTTDPENRRRKPVRLTA